MACEFQKALVQSYLVHQLESKQDLCHHKGLLQTEALVHVD
ncbi:hypothetical protein MtrunA17_Chr8g0353701 [Medicago truncatula]|uniref:Uncharacterized protein n=1 Tax=Medicago truncatula TaxID=3880 RepID=A0A396GNN6_MEDTR|nr:hypothetical protein MtrunA17_Chr8g0353701 [Medicago truncatula]